MTGCKSIILIIGVSKIFVKYDKWICLYLFPFWLQFSFSLVTLTDMFTHLMCICLRNIPNLHMLIVCCSFAVLHWVVCLLWENICLIGWLWKPELTDDVHGFDSEPFIRTSQLSPEKLKSLTDTYMQSFCAIWNMRDRKATQCTKIVSNFNMVNFPKSSDLW